MAVKAGDAMWRARLKNSYGLMETIFFAVDKDSTVRHAPSDWNFLDGISLKAAKKLLKKLDEDVEIRIAGVRVEYH